MYHISNKYLIINKIYIKYFTKLSVCLNVHLKQENIVQKVTKMYLNRDIYKGYIRDI